MTINMLNIVLSNDVIYFEIFKEMLLYFFFQESEAAYCCSIFKESAIQPNLTVIY